MYKKVVLARTTHGILQYYGILINYQHLGVHVEEQGVRLAALLAPLSDRAVLPSEKRLPLSVESGALCRPRPSLEEDKDATIVAVDLALRCVSAVCSAFLALPWEILLLRDIRGGAVAVAAADFGFGLCPLICSRVGPEEKRGVTPCCRW